MKEQKTTEISTNVSSGAEKVEVIEKQISKINETASIIADFLLNENIKTNFPFII